MHIYQLVVPNEFMRFLKIEAAKADITIKEYIMTAVRDKAERDNKLISVDQVIKNVEMGNGIEIGNQ